MSVAPENERVEHRHTRMILEFDMYAPYLFPGANVWLFPFQAAIPPPHARFASVTFSNHLMQTTRNN